MNTQKIINQLGLLSALVVGLGLGLVVLAVEPTVTITEVMANPDGADANREWIEIYNYGADPITIIGGQASSSWRFKDASSHLLNLGTSTVVLASGSLAILASDAATFLTEHQNFLAPVIDTTMSLTNNGGQISISNDNGQTWFEIVNYSTTTEGRSWEKINPTTNNEAANWRVSLVAGGSPGQLSAANENNNQEENNQASSTPNQEVEVVASSTPSSTPEVVVDQASNTPEVEVVAQTNDQAEIIIQSSGQSSSQQLTVVKIVINELLPNPIGSDERGEFIELYNPNTEPINLADWRLQDQSPMVFTIDEDRVTSTIIYPQSYWTVYRPQAKLVLNNSGTDGARLYNPAGEVIDEVNYSEAEEGQSYSLVNNKWIWQSPTPGENNNIGISQVVSSASATIVILDNPGLVGRKVKLAVTISGQFKPKTYQWNFGDGSMEEENKVSHVYQQPGQYTVKVTTTDSVAALLTATTVLNIVSSSQTINKIVLDKSMTEAIDPEQVVNDFSQLLEVDSKTIIQLNAVVVVPAGVTKKDQIWLGEYNDETGEVNTDNLWPLTISKTKVLAGQIVIAPIKVSHLAAGSKLRLAGELKVIDQIAEPSAPDISLAEATEAIKNSLAAVSGVIVKVNQKSLVIADEDNELKINLTTSSLDYKVGDKIEANGLITMSGKTVVLYPKKIQKVTLPPATSTLEQSVTTSTTTVPQTNNKQPAYIVGGFSVLAGLGWALLKWRSMMYSVFF